MIRLRWLIRFFVAGVAAALFAASASAQTEEQKTQKDAILILDASGSMWGQIEGVNKIVIAKDVVEGLVRSLPVEQRLGLVAYGHRKEGDCSDIQTIADVGADRSKLIDAIRALSPKGKTPLTQSVQHAADALNYTKNAASVVLVSDGLETCEADPCALARTLEENGLDFTVHVIGFDVTVEEREGLKCIADETGGEFLAADNAEELTDALGQVAIAGEAQPSDGEGEPVPSTVAMKATILSGGPHIQSDISWKITPAAGGEPVFAAGAAYPETELPPGDYVVEAVWTGWRKGKPDGGGEKTGRMEFSLAPQQPKVLTVPIDLGIPVTLDAPASTPEGVAFDVTWTGPDTLGGYISVNRNDDGPRAFIYSSPAARARTAYENAAEDKTAIDTDGDGDFDADDKATVAIGGPSTAGEYEVRYVLDSPRLILARKPITVTDSQYVLRAPESAPVGSVLTVEWEGPMTDGDFLTLIAAGSEKVFQNGVTARLAEGEPAKITVPAEPGQYEIRYILANGYTLYPGMQHVVQASRAIEITDVSASLSAPASAVGGSTIDVVWDGPPQDWENDWLSVVETGAAKSNRDSTAKLSKAGEALKPAPIRVPAVPGEYEIVYIIQPGQRIIARTPITITKAQASVDAPATVKAGSDFSISYSGDGFKGDRVVVVNAETPDNKMWGVGTRYGFPAREGETQGNVKADAIRAGPGEYEARYVTGLQHQVLARDKFTIVE